MTDSLDGFVRALVNYYPQNKNRAEPDFTVPTYSLVNLYPGVRGRDGAWEASIFTRNAFKNQTTLDVATNQAVLNSPLSQFFSGLIHPSGYYRTQVTRASRGGNQPARRLGAR